MTVCELIEKLEAMDPTHQVVMAADAEGNGYAPLADLKGGHTYVDDEIYPTTHEDPDEMYEGTDGVESVVLFP